MALKVPYSLLKYVFNATPEFERRSGAKITYDNNLVSFSGEPEQIQQALQLISELMVEKSDVVPPRLDLCLKVDKISEDVMDIGEFPKYFENEGTRFKFIETENDYSALVEFSTVEERDYALHHNPLPKTTPLIFSIPDPSTFDQDKMKELSQQKPEAKIEKSSFDSFNQENVDNKRRAVCQFYNTPSGAVKENELCTRLNKSWCLNHDSHL